MKYDFGGYATKNDLQCSDGRTIRKDAFKDNNGTIVPLVWQHMHNDPGNVLGHAYLENRKDGVYAYCKFNDTDAGKNAKALVKHGDITALSIYANQLKEQAGNVLHGVIREVSLVLSGANPGALIDNLAIAHSDGSQVELEDEAIIYTDDSISTDEIEHSSEEDDEETIKEIFDSMTDKQKQVVYYLLAEAANQDQSDFQHSDDEEDDENDEEDDEEDDENDSDEENNSDDVSHSNEKGGKNMKKNVFDNSKNQDKNNVLTHSQIDTIFKDAQKMGSLKEAALAHANEYGIQNIDVLFPDAQPVSRDPNWIQREDDWVPKVLNAIHKSPFSRVKTVIANMDFDAARAKGYIKGNIKKETYLKASKRIVTPTTVYAKQKLDRDDIIDITDFDTVGMIRYEMRTLLNEELARCAMIGDGRELSDPDKVSEDSIIPIWKDNAVFAVREELQSSKTDYKALIKEIALSHTDYKGSGSPVFYTSPATHINMLWVEDTLGRRIYSSDAELCAALGVSAIVEIPLFEGLSRKDEAENTYNLLGIKVNLRDYNFGANKGGEVASFDDFDIDYNQYKYLMETRCSGGLTKPSSAQIYEFKTAKSTDDQNPKG